MDCDVRAFRALGHPLRLELLDALRVDGPSTATFLARRLGESSGATSYHLRQLARHGFVEEASGCGKGRERWWRHAERRLELPAGVGDASARAAAAGVLAELLGREADALDHFVAVREGQPEWATAGLFARRISRLTPAGLESLNDRFAALLDELPVVDAEPAADGATPVHVVVFTFPDLIGDTT